MKSKAVLILLLIAMPRSILAAEWQWSVAVDSVVSPETNDHPRAFLWIPPTCKRVRAVVIGQHNMEEEPILEHPTFRKAVADLDFAEIWITPALDGVFRFDKGAGEHFDAMLKALAEASGYTDLATAPIVPIGHSAMASFPWNFAASNPSRTLAAISFSGQWPFYKDQTMPDWGERNIDGVPGIVTMGEYEWANENWAKGAAVRVAHPMSPLSMLGCEADGHFEPTDEKVAYLAMYLRKAAEYRLPRNGTAALKPIDPTKQGWLADRYRKDQAPKWPAAPVGKYTGDPKEAFWYFDEELAKAAEEFGARHRGKKVPLIGYVQDGAVVEQNPKLHAQVPLKFFPDPNGDGLTFKFSTTFIDTVPEGRPTKWTGLAKGAHVDHPDAAGKIKVSRICGPVEQVGPDTWAIRFYRMGMNNPKRSNDLWFVAIYPGDEHFKQMVQQAQMRFPLRNDRGNEQTITFPAIADQKPDAEPIKPGATSSAGATVHYYVREGPAEIVDGNTIKFTAIPARAKFPVKVTVVAWQWGRSVPPLLKSAEPVERTFNITP